MLDEGEVSSLAQIGKIVGLTRARVTQIMNLLKLSAGLKEFLTNLHDPLEIRKYSERRLRKILKSEMRIKELKINWRKASLTPTNS